MKSKTLCIATLTLVTALAIPVRLAAQKQIRYTVTDVGTLGGTKGPPAPGCQAGMRGV